MEIIQHFEPQATTGEDFSIVVDNFYHDNGATLSLPDAGFDWDSIDVISMFLQSQSNENTRKNYKHHLQKFFGEAPANRDVRRFLMLPPPRLSTFLQAHRNKLVDAGAKSAAINGRLAAVKSLLKFSYRQGWSSCNGRDLIDMEPVRSYRDTRGISKEAATKLLRAPAKLRGNGMHGLRDTAIVALFGSLALRCNEVRLLDVGDFDLMGRRLRIMGKGRRQHEYVSIPVGVAATIETYLRAAGHHDDRNGPLFRSLDRRPKYNGQRLTNYGIATLLQPYKAYAGVTKLNPHQLRHYAISNLLLETDGNLFLVAQFSRHIDPKIVEHYWDKLKDLQGEGAEIMYNLLTGQKPKRKRKA